MIHFIRPYWLFALIPMMIYLSWIIYAAKIHNPWRRVCDPHLLQALLQDEKNSSRRWFYSLLFLFLALMIFALSGPAWHKTKLPLYRETNSIMVVLDLSNAMDATDLKPNRLQRAKFKIRDLIAANKNTQMGLVAFSGEAFVASPVSQDANTLSAMLDELSPRMMPTIGSDSAAGLQQGLALLNQSDIAQANILLITASEPTAESWNVAKAIRDAGNQLHVLAMIDNTQENQNVISQLQQLARLGGGTLQLFTPDNTDIQTITHGKQTLHMINDDNMNHVQLWQDAGPWFSLLLLPIALLLLREKVL